MVKTNGTFGIGCLKISTKIEYLNDLQECWKHNGGKKMTLPSFVGVTWL
jgi:hypothetical protein